MLSLGHSTGVHSGQGGRPTTMVAKGSVGGGNGATDTHESTLNATDFSSWATQVAPESFAKTAVANTVRLYMPRANRPSPIDSDSGTQAMAEHAGPSTNRRFTLPSLERSPPTR